jgi:hypothetical protein
MIKLKYIITLMALSTLGIGCISEIQLNTEPGDLTTLVVDGDFTNSKSEHRLFLSRPNKYGVSKFEHVPNAKISIHDDAGNKANYIETLSSELIPYYQLAANALPAVPGRSYFIEIALEDGTMYRSVPQVMPVFVPLDTVRLNPRVVPRLGNGGIVVEDRLAFVEVETPLPTANNPIYLRWDANCVYYFPELSLPGPLPPPTKQCYVTDFFNDQFVPLIELSNQGGSTFKYEIGNKFVDKAFEKGAYFNVIQRSVTAESFNYWKKLSRVSNPEGTVFDAPPGTLLGNISNVSNPDIGVLGFFEVSSVDTFRIKVFNNTLGPDFTVGLHCDQFDYYRGSDQECFDCLRLKNSTIVQPHYWR